MNRQIGLVLPYARISAMTSILIERTLPAPGEILVHVGEQVGALQKIARVPVRGEIRVVNVARALGLDDPDLSHVMVKKRGDLVEAGETIAARRGALPFLHKPCRSPVAGRLVNLGHGWVVIETESKTKVKELQAFVPGRVSAIAHNRSVTIETTGAYIKGACGIGGEGNGVLQVPVNGPAADLAPDDIKMGFHDAVLVGGAHLSAEALARAREMKVGALIVGSIDAALHDLAPTLPFPIVATEGYGKMPMSPAVFEILKRLEGYQVSVSGRMGDPWGHVRSEIIVPLETEVPASVLPSQEDNGFLNEPTQVGDWVRAVRQPFSGQIGEVVAMPGEPNLVPSGLWLAGAQVAFAREQRPAKHVMPASQFVPWHNLERISRDFES